MKRSRPADSRAQLPHGPLGADEDEIGVLLRHCFADGLPSEEFADTVASERWNDLADRIVADLERDALSERMEIHCAEMRRIGLMLRPWSSLSMRLT